MYGTLTLYPNPPLSSPLGTVTGLLVAWVLIPAAAGPMTAVAPPTPAVGLWPTGFWPAGLWPTGFWP